MVDVIRINKATLVVNIIDLKQETIVLVFPGGGYQLLSNREASPVATKFNMLGYNSAVLYYSTKPFIMYAEARLAIKELSKRFKNIFVVGFSAGGHLAGMVATMKNKYNLKGAILAYPVVSFIKYPEEETVAGFLGNQLNEENMIKYSIENRVNKKTVPMYIWTTITDTDVPYDNSVLLSNKLNEYHIYNELELFNHGDHGLALADETAVVANDKERYIFPDVAKWPNNADKFIQRVLSK